MSKIISELTTAAAAVWQSQREHPFIAGLADGTLAAERFERWVRQDYLYLIDYARVLGMAAARADQLESMIWFARLLHLTLEIDMELHRGHGRRLGVSAVELAAGEPWPTTRAYADFMVRVAATGEAAERVAALLPCAWGHAELAGELVRRKPPAGSPYLDWIRQYSSPDFRQAADWLMEELDRLAGDATQPVRDRLREIFLAASRYELAFWEMCWNGERWPGERPPG